MLDRTHRGDLGGVPGQRQILRLGTSDAVLGTHAPAQLSNRREHRISWRMVGGGWAIDVDVHVALGEMAEGKRTVRLHQ